MTIDGAVRGDLRGNVTSQLPRSSPSPLKRQLRPARARSGPAPEWRHRTGLHPHAVDLRICNVVWAWPSGLSPLRSFTLNQDRYEVPLTRISPECGGDPQGPDMRESLARQGILFV